ncbi:MAG: substrate-binding periplasmic protein [Inhella sp.]|uniref:substrate-binding periplasmic protein n=1 Tax=Inhella sp. TaxID=1921806 RepID=UPI0022C4135E|nr:transporter substrate-binding domain-containing protein [Inhella sp.]MCZ8235824.1 transporter substrate-binding domain-containing protein [Inhella sp.]
MTHATHRSTPWLASWMAALALACAADAVRAASLAPLKLSTHELPPYSTQGRGRPSGLAVDVVVCAAKRLPLGLELEFVPWARAQKHAQEGQSDGFFAASQSAERDAYATRSVTIAPQEWRWYALRSRPWQPSHPEFKAQARVSSFLGANMQTWLKEQGYRVQSPPTQSTALLNMLMAGRLDAILANHLVMDQLLAAHPRKGEVVSHLALDKPLSVYLVGPEEPPPSPLFHRRGIALTGAIPMA